MLELLEFAVSAICIVSFIAIIRPFPKIGLPTRLRAVIVWIGASLLFAAIQATSEESKNTTLSTENQTELSPERGKKALIDSFMAIKGKKFGTSEFYDMKQKYGKYGEFVRLDEYIPDHTVEYSEGLDVSFVLNEATDKIIFTGRGRSAEDYMKRRIEKGFSKWDGSHRELTKHIKDSMNDPDSYEHIETIFWKSREYMTVQTKFRGKNAYGAIVQDKIKAKVSYEGEVLEITSLRGPTLSTGQFGSKLH